MFMNCGQVRRRDDGAVRIEIWDGRDAYEFVITRPDDRSRRRRDR